MRKKLIQLLRQLELESGFKSEYSEFWESYGRNYSVEEYLDFPNYRFITQRFNDLHAVQNRGIVAGEELLRNDEDFRGGAKLC